MDIITKYRNLSVQTKATVWYTICNFLQKGISFLVVPIYVRLLTTAEYGVWNVFQSWRDILIIFASLNLYCGVYTKVLVGLEKKDRDQFTASMQSLGTAATFVMLVLYILTHNLVDQLLGFNKPVMLLLFLYFVVYPAFSFWTARERVEYRYMSMIAATIFVSVLTPSVSLLLLKFTTLRANALILGYLSVQCLVGLFFYFYHYYKGRCFYNKNYWEYALRFNIPLIPHYLSLIVLSQSDRIMIKYYCGESDAGIYGFAYQLGSAIALFSSAINGSRVPWTYERLKKQDYQSLTKITTALVLMMATITILVALLSPEVIRILGTDKYESAVFVIPIVTLGIYFTFCYDLYSTIEFYFSVTKKVMVASLVGAVVNVVLNAIFIPKFGFIAAAYTTLICYIILTIMHYLFAMQAQKDNYIQTSVYDNRSMFILSASTILLCIGIIFTYPYPLLRGVIIAVILITVFIKRNMIIDIIKAIRK